MQDKLFTLFIVLLGLFTAYVFYALWHTEEINPPPLEKKLSIEKKIEDLSNKKIIPKKTLTPSSKPPLQNIDKKHEKISFKTKEEMEIHTQAVYSTLMPKEHEERMEDVNLAFDKLDEYVDQLDEELFLEEKSREE